MAENHSPTSTATTTEPDDMASYTQDTDFTSTNSSPQHGRLHAVQEEWYDSKTPTLEQNSFSYQEHSPDLDLLQSDFSYTHSIQDHATTMRKSMVFSDSMASVALADINSRANGNSSEKTTQLAMTNSPSFSALAHILERKEAKFGKKQQPTITPIVEQQETHSPYQPSPLSTEQKIVVPADSPNLIEFDDDTNGTDSPKLNGNAPLFIAAYNTAPTTDIFKTPDVPQAQRFPHQEYTSMLEPIESSPNPPTAQFSDSSDEDEAQQQKPLPLPKSPKKMRSPLLSEQYTQRSTSMPVVNAQQKKDTKEKRRSFMNFFRNRRTVSSSNVPKKSPSFSIPSPSVQSDNSPPTPDMKTLKGSKSFTLPKSNAQVAPRPAAQRSTSSTSLFAAFKRKKSQTSTEEPTPQPAINVHSPEPNDNDDDGDNDTFSVSSGEFNEDFNNLNEVGETTESSYHTANPPALLIPSQPLQNKRLSQISQSESKRYSQASQGETLFPKNLSAQEVESIVSLERNRSLSRQSMNSRRQSNHVEQNIPTGPSFESLSGTSIQMSPGRFQTSVDVSPVYRRDYLSGDGDDLYDDDDEDEEEEEGGLFDVEEFSHRLEFDEIADHYTPDLEEDMSHQFAEFADFINFGGALDLDLGFEDENKSPLSQPALINSPQVSSIHEEESFMPSPQLSQRSPLSSPFLQQTAFNSSLQRPVSMSFRGLKAPAFNTMHASDSMDSIQTSQSITSSFRSASASMSSVKKGHRVVFSSKITVFDVHAACEYDRTPDIATCNQLTPQLAMMVRRELNDLKSEMEVHEDSRCYTHFY